MAILAVFVEPAFSIYTGYIGYIYREKAGSTNPYNSKVTQQCRRSYFEPGLPVVDRDNFFKSL